MRITQITKFLFEDGTTVEFFPLARTELPGFSHRVIINGKKHSVLGDTDRPSRKVATFFYERYKRLSK